VVTELEALPGLGDDADPARPLLEIVVVLDKPEPRLRERVDSVLEGKRPRMVTLLVEKTGDGAALADAFATRRLAEFEPREVFERCWARSHAEPPSDAVRAAFERLVIEVRGDEVS